MRTRIAAAMVLFALFGCKEKPSARVEPVKPSASTSHEGEKAHDTIPKRAKLPMNVIEAAKIRTAIAKKEVLAPTMALPGELAADPDKSARVSSPVAGRLSDVRFKEGSTVKKGDVLAMLRIPEIGKVRAAYSATNAKAAAARANAQRLEGLTDKGMAAKQEAIAARAEAACQQLRQQRIHHLARQIVQERDGPERTHDRWETRFRAPGLGRFSHPRPNPTARGWWECRRRPTPRRGTRPGKSRSQHARDTRRAATVALAVPRHRPADRRVPRTSGEPPPPHGVPTRAIDPSAGGWPNRT